jgi:hypothetical protein
MTTVDAAPASLTDLTMAVQELDIKTSNHVYIQHPQFSWIPARVLETNSEKQTALLSIPTYKEEQSIISDGGRTAKRFEKQEITLTSYPNGAMPLQNVDFEGRLKEVQDMVDLPFLHEVG